MSKKPFIASPEAASPSSTSVAPEIRVSHIRPIDAPKLLAYATVDLQFGPIDPYDPQASRIRLHGFRVWRTPSGMNPGIPKAAAHDDPDGESSYFPTCDLPPAWLQRAYTVIRIAWATYEKTGVLPQHGPQPDEVF